MTITAPMRLDVWPTGNPTPEQRAEVLAAHERLKDRDPRELSPEDLAAIGHEKQPLLRVIRANCIQCQGGNAADMRRCRCTGCPFWPYRMATNPFAAARSEAQMANARAFLRKPHSLGAESDGQARDGDEAAPEGAAEISPSLLGKEIAP
jgi:hypothetical protein